MTSLTLRPVSDQLQEIYEGWEPHYGRFNLPNILATHDFDGDIDATEQEVNDFRSQLGTDRCPGCGSFYEFGFVCDRCDEV